MGIVSYKILISFFGDWNVCSWFVHHNNPWFNRGSGMHVGSDTGVFAFSNGNGHVNSDVSFRVVLLFTMISCWY